jgi:para-nitrobenzyl esterase
MNTTKRLLAGVTALAIALSSATAAMSQAPAAGRPAPRDPNAGVVIPAMANPAQGPVIKVSGGQVRGVLSDGVETYMAVPFAAAPVGDLRWRSPKPVVAWKGVLDGQKPSATCAQSEDCLFLNVWRPAGVKPGAKLPVMLWIHGGSFTGGSGMNGFGANHDGSALARQDVITVTVNYRLGRAGWFSHPALTKEGESGNFGLEDQIAALKWVQANIGHLGGDTKNVTIFGESAGAISVLLLMSAPPAQGLFQKAISESGFPRMVPADRKLMDKFAADVAAKAGVTGDDAKAAAALRKLPLNAFPNSTGTSDQTRPYPIEDGKLIAGGPAKMFAAGKEAKIPLIIGGNSNEASLYRPQAPNWAGVTDRRAQLVSLFQPAGSSDLQAVNDYVTAMRMTEPNRNAARLHTKNGQPTWTFYFSYVTPAQRATTLGAIHVAEIPYAFNSVPRTADAQDLSTAQSMNAYWASFAKYGNPAAAGGVQWNKYTPASQDWIEFTYDGTRARQNLLGGRLDFLEQAAGGQANGLPAPLANNPARY